MSILIPIIAVTVIGLLCAVMLVVASKFMEVKVDERIPAVRECLPGANCGACGYAGCDGYAKALVEDDAATNLCVPGGADAASAVSAVLGKKCGEVVRQTAFVHCKGDCGVTGEKYEYQGIKTCAAAKLMFGGSGKCSFGCLGLGDCASVCPENAVCIENGLARIDTRACIGCGLCAKACPNALITVQPEKTPTKVACSNKEKGVAVRQKCSAGCIGCGMCMKKCPEGAISLVNNLAVIDASKCTGCGECKAVCPVKCIAG